MKFLYKISHTLYEIYRQLPTHSSVDQYLQFLYWGTIMNATVMDCLGKSFCEHVHSFLSGKFLEWLDYCLTLFENCQFSKPVAPYYSATSNVCIPIEYLWYLFKKTVEPESTGVIWTLFCFIDGFAHCYTNTILLIIVDIQ